MQISLLFAFIAQRGFPGFGDISDTIARKNWRHHIDSYRRNLDGTSASVFKFRDMDLSLAVSKGR